MKRATLGLALMLSTGCANGAFMAVDFDRLDVREVDWERIDTDFVFRVQNPAPIGITLARFDYTLSLDGVELAAGDDPNGVEIRAADDSELALPVASTWRDLYALATAERGDDGMPFEIEGSLGFDTPAGPLDLPFDAEGDFPALRAPSFRYDRVRVESFDIFSAALAIDIDVDNEHGSALDFVDFGYALELEGIPVATGALSTFAVQGGDSGTVSIPIELDLLDVGTALVDAIQTDTVGIGLAADVDVQTPLGLIPLAVDESGSVDIDW